MNLAELEINKKEYLILKHNLKRNAFNDLLFKYFYIYWINHKKEGYKNLSFDEFSVEFRKFLMVAMSNINFDNIFKYFDNHFNVTKVTDLSTNNVLTEY